MRLVCDLWNRTILTLPRPRLTLCLDPWENCRNATPYQIFCTDIDTRLVKSLESRLLEPFKFHSKEKLFHVSVNFGRSIKNFSVTCNPDFLPTLYEILRNRCPNLRRLKIELQPTRFANTDEHLPPPCTLDKLVSLKIIDTTPYPDLGLATMTQWILYSAENLTHFFHEGNNHLPNLGQNDRLKLLELNLNCMKSDAPVVYNIGSVNRVLNQVKAHVEVFYD